jgi:Domain of unknown function (DUF4214)
MTPTKLRRGKEPVCRNRPLAVEELEPRALPSAVSSAAYSLLSDRVEANQAAFFVYQDADSGLNHGFPSGKFASNNDPAIINGIGVDTAFVDDATGLDRLRGTVLQVTFPRLASGQFAGLNIEEPENNGANPRGMGYNLTGATQVVFEARSPTPGGIKVQFGVGGKVSDQNSFFQLSSGFTSISIPLGSLRDPASNAISPPDLTNTHLLFAVATNDVNAPNGGTVLLDNIRFEPVLSSHVGVPSLPLDTETFGVVPVLTPPVNQPVPPDQANRNISTIYVAALTELSLLNRGSATDLTNARQLADTLVYALHNDIKGDGLPGHGDPLPTAPDGAAGLHNAYSSGDLPLFNDQQPDQGKKGQTRLSGFTGPAGFELILDGATGGNNAFGILALTAAYCRFGDTRYLDAAREIGRWITANLTDTTNTGYGGYFLGYPDMGITPKTVQTGKSIENNADIFAAFTELAAFESGLGNTSAATDWTTRANIAGDFVMALYDAAGKRFNAGTVPVGTGQSAGIDPSGPTRGNDVINRADFLDSNSFTTLALASSARYRNQIDWRDPVQYMVDHFAQTITAGGQTFQGFNIVPQPTATPGDSRNSPGPNGIAWEFTGQAVETMRFVDALYGDTRFNALADFYLGQIAHAQTAAPFADGRGLVAATLQDGDRLAPLDQCLTTPFQCIPERVGLPATTWAILADEAGNPLAPRFVAAPLPDAADTFVQALYSDFLGRSADATEIAGWRAVLVNRGSAPVVAGVARSEEALRRFVDEVYRYILARPADPAGEASWVAQLERGVLNVEGLIVGFLLSPEFTASHPTDDSFISALGSLLFCRAFNADQVASFQNLLSRFGRSSLTESVVKGPDFGIAVVETLYGNRPMSSMPCLTFVPNLLQRVSAPMVEEVTGWVNSGLDILETEVRIASSPEYFRRDAGQANPNFIKSLYRHALLRAGAESEMGPWTDQLVRAGSRPVAEGIEKSSEARMSLVAGWYARYLGRPAVNNEGSVWVNQLLAGASEEQVLSGILASGEFLNRTQSLFLSGLPEERFIQSLYRLLLERLPSPAEVSGWLNAVDADGRQAVALAFLTLPEHRQIAVRGYYTALMHRTAADGEVNGWVSSPLDLGAIRILFESSPEFNLNG